MKRFRSGVAGAPLLEQRCLAPAGKSIDSGFRVNSESPLSGQQWAARKSHTRSSTHTWKKRGIAGEARFCRPAGTLLSGFLYTYAGDSIVTGFGACFAASLAFVLLSSVLALPIRDDAGGLACGPCLRLRAQPPPTAEPAAPPPSA